MITITSPKPHTRFTTENIIILTGTNGPPTSWSVPGAGAGKTDLAGTEQETSIVSGEYRHKVGKLPKGKWTITVVGPDGGTASVIVVVDAAPTQTPIDQGVNTN